MLPPQGRGHQRFPAMGAVSCRRRWRWPLLVRGPPSHGWSGSGGDVDGGGREPGVEGRGVGIGWQGGRTGTSVDQVA